MSLHVQECLNNRRYFGRGKKYKHQQSYDERIYSDKYIMSLMTLERELDGHLGCVNTLDWSMAGDKLLSGSDDTRLNIYHPFENYKQSHSIQTGHQANIFTAKFMPQTSDNIIISGAGDSEIRIFDIKDPTSPLDSMYVCHSDQVKKICVYDDNPFEFLTCSQDGTVRHFDRRIPHVCSPHNVRSFITAQSKPARQHPLPKSSSALRDGCPSAIVDYSKYNIELNSITINKIFPHYFAVAGMNDYIYLHDRRMLPSRSTSASNNVMESLKCIKRFSPTLDGTNRPNRHITACKFSNTNSYELLGSWSSDNIYLFNINDSVVEPLTEPTPSPTHKNTILLNEPYENQESDQKKLLWNKIFEYLDQQDLDHAYNATNNLLHYINHHATPSFDSTLGKVCCAMVHATIYSYRRMERDDWYPEPHSWDSYFFASELHTVEQKLEEAKAFAASIEETWQSSWALAVGYWIWRGGYKAIANVDRKDVLDQSFEYLIDAQTTHLVSQQQPLTQLDRTYIDMMHLFLLDLKYALLGDTVRSQTYQWGKLMYITLFSPEEVRAYLGLQATRDQSSSSSSSSDTQSASDSSSSSDQTAFRAFAESDVEEEEEEMTLYARIMNRQIMDIYRRSSLGEDEDDSDLDLEELAVYRDYSQQNFQTDVGVVRPRAKYQGHCNIDTVKDVDFFGSNDEYIVSGSDGGHLFIWDKKTSKIVQILQADNEIVNVAKGHPTLPILAVSGIDSTTKIFTPTSRPFTTSRITEPNNPMSYSTSSRMYEEDDIVNMNRLSNRSLGADIYITRSMIAALSRISQLNQFRLLNDINMEEEDSSE